ncbi:MAG TPA: flavodoxin [Lachnospiraceae bacterium]|nr:flavodoxin [Lachnospiraceae bacterium]
MKKQRIRYIIACLVMGCVFAACGAGTGADTGRPELETQPESGAGGNGDGQETPDISGQESTGDAAGVLSESEAGKIIVVYYSATGCTEKVARLIAASQGAYLFGLEPVEPYSEQDLDWKNTDSRVCLERDGPEAKEVALVMAEVPDWDSYTTVFVGFPLWWGNAAWPVNGFIGANDFTGKTVVPFCTSASSGLGDSVALLSEMAGAGKWLEGKRFASDADEDDVAMWMEELYGEAHSQ